MIAIVAFVITTKQQNKKRRKFTGILINKKMNIEFTGDNKTHTLTHPPPHIQRETHTHVQNNPIHVLQVMSS